MKITHFLLTAVFAILFSAENADAFDVSKATKSAKKANAELNQIAKKLGKLQSEKIKIDEDERGVVLTFSTQLFAVGKADLTDEAKESLLEAAKTLAEFPNANVEIEGHTDSDGSAKLNQDLSELRAKNVMSFLVKQGIAKERLSAVGYGKDRPIADNGTEDGRATNRRVELIVNMEEEEEQKPQEKKNKGTRFGVRAGFNLYDFSSGENESDKYIDMGNGFGAGLVINIPITTSLTFAPELNLLYRKLFSIDFKELYDSDLEYWETELAISIPVMLQFMPIESVPFYLAVGIQLDIPIMPERKYKTDEIEITADYSERSSIDFGFPIGLGYFITDNISMDIRIFIGVTNPDKDFDDTSYNSYGLGITYFFK